MMTEVLYFVVGTVFGIVLARLWSAAGNRWRRARGMMRAPDKVRSENKKKIEKAKEEAAKGRGELLRATLYFIVVILIGAAMAWMLITLS